MSSTNNDSEDDDPRVHSSGLSSSSQPRRYELSKSELRKVTILLIININITMQIDEIKH